MWIRLVGFHLVVPVFRRLGVSQLAVDTTLIKPSRLGGIGLGYGVSSVRAGGRCSSSGPTAGGRMRSIQTTS